MAVEELEDAGFAEVGARHADEAWFVLHERSDIGVLFAEVDMPGSMCGVTLAERSHERWPDLRPVLTSGRHRFADGEVPDHGHFVPNPTAPPKSSTPCTTQPDRIEPGRSADFIA